MRAILESRTLPQLKKMIRDTNITGYSKLKKSEIIDKMMKEDERFKQYVLKNHTTPKTPIKKTTTHKIPDGKIMSGTTHKKESKEVKKPEVKKEVKKPEVKKEVKTPLQEIKNYINNDLMNDYKKIQTEYNKENQDKEERLTYKINDKLYSLVRKLVDSDLPLNLDNISKKIEEDIRNIARKNGVLGGDVLDIFLKPFKLKVSNQWGGNTTYIINPLKNRQKDIDNAINDYTFVQSFDEARYKKTKGVIKDINSIDTIDRDAYYSKKRTPKQIEDKKEISKRMRNKDYLKGVYRINPVGSFILPSLYNSKGLVEKIVSELNKKTRGKALPNVGNTLTMTLTEFKQFYKDRIERIKKNI